MRRTSKTTQKNSQDLFNRITKDAPGLKAEIERQASAVNGNISTARRRQIYTGILDKYYSETLPKYNFEYIARNKPYRYNR